MQLRLIATVGSDRLVFRFVDGSWHSDISITAHDPLDVLAAHGLPTTPGPALWSLDELDAALSRAGYARTGPWRGGPTAHVTRPT